MKKLLLLSFALISAFSFAQDDKENELDEAPYDFLDLFDETRRDKETVLTNTKLFLAFGFNQALGDGNGIGEDYRFWGSGIFDVGLEFSTRLNKEDDLFRLTYGLNLRTQTLRVNDNRVFETQNNVTNLVSSPLNLDRSRFSQVSFVAPLHIEIGRRDLKDYEDGIKRYGGDDPFIAGIGGYIGYAAVTSQEIKFDREGRNVTSTLTNDFVINKFQYGLSAYAGWNDTQFFVTYGLNTILDNSPIEQQHFSFGIRLR